MSGVAGDKDLVVEDLEVGGQAQLAGRPADLARQIDGHHAGHAARCAAVRHDRLPAAIRLLPLDADRFPADARLAGGIDRL